MNLTSRAKSIITDPNSFFKKLKVEDGIKGAFLYLAIFSFVAAILGVISKLYLRFYWLSFAWQAFGSFAPRLEYTFAKLFPFTLVSYLASLILSFVGAALLHAWILLFGGKANYSKTYQLAIYSGTPGYLYGWIPFVGVFLAYVHNLILLVIGTHTVHGISKKRAILMYLIPNILMVLALVVFYYISFKYLQNMKTEFGV